MVYQKFSHAFFMKIMHASILKFVDLNTFTDDYNYNLINAFFRNLNESEFLRGIIALYFPYLIE